MAQALQTMWAPLDRNPARRQISDLDLFDVLEDAWEAFEEGDVHTLRRILGKHPPLLRVEYRHGGNTLLHVAVIENKPQLVSLLLDLGAPLGRINRSGTTAANLACINDDTLECLKRMLNYITADVVDVHGYTPLHTAVQRNAVDCVQLLCSRLGFLTAQPDHAGVHPVHLAAKLVWPGSLRVLLDAGCDPNTGDAHLATPLHMLAQAPNTKAHTILESGYRLIRSGADVNAQDDAGRTPLLIAAAFDNQALASCLLLCGCTLDIPDHHGSSPVQVACAQNSMRVADALLATYPSILLRFDPDLFAGSSVAKTMLLRMRSPSSLQERCADRLRRLYERNMRLLCRLPLPPSALSALFFNVQPLFLVAYALNRDDDEVVGQA